jgi:hypothetical protein
LFGGNNVPVWSPIAGIKSLANDVWQNNVEVTDIYDKESETSTVGGVEISFN